MTDSEFNALWLKVYQEIGRRAAENAVLTGRLKVVVEELRTLRDNSASEGTILFCNRVLKELGELP